MAILLGTALSKSEMDWMNLKWFELANKLGLSLTLAEAVFTEIKTRYTEKHRAYHNLTHLYSMLRLSENYNVLNRPLLESAIWFHDSIYSATRKDNERKSADFALDKLSSCSNCTAKFFNDLDALIMSTQRHHPLIDNPDCLLLLDLDLAVLATPAESYAQYVKAIRAEYKIYPDLLYKPGRKKVLRSFLERDSIYFLDAHRDWEAAARENLLAEIS